jgi:hypothetical protein
MGEQGGGRRLGPITGHNARTHSKTRPSRTGSWATPKTIGMIAVAVLAASAACRVAGVTITADRRRIGDGATWVDWTNAKSARKNRHLSQLWFRAPATRSRPAARDAIPPESEEAKHIVERYGTALAAAKGGAFDHGSGEDTVADSGPCCQPRISKPTSEMHCCRFYITPELS